MAKEDHGLDRENYDLYEDVPEDISTSLIPGIEFSDDEFDRIPVYTPAELNDNQLVAAATKFLESLGKKNCPAGMQYYILVLAQRLSKTERGQYESFLAEDRPTGGSDLDNSIKSHIYANVTVADSEKEGKSTEEVAKLRADKIFGAANTSPLRTQKDEDLVKNATFIAAYLLRALTKSADNVGAAWTGMKARFLSFYGMSLLQSITTLDRNYVVDLKNLLASDPKVGHTWVRTVASAEHRLSVNDNTAGMIRFLGVLPLSMTGMHAYKLFLEIKRQSNLSSKWLLRELTSPRTKPGLTEIRKILINFEDRVNEKKSGKFKYARLMSPAFFQHLQTKSCPDLVYVEICILNKYEAFPANQDPNKIIGIEKVPESMKDQLKEVANNIVTAAPQRNAGMYSTSMKKVFLPTDKKSETKSAAKKNADQIFS
ncbi:N protein [Cytorhabdovirus hordei]|uniref:Nucleoprotein n=1 Tax=Cytorhabdovirus hordei TaxID=1985699 RepID=A0A0C5L1Y5_9RHAB|nr:N protein [Cytorhabdovirus hordei]AJP67515.1 N protein [Cytorhabdovirus hordei]